VPVPPVRIEHRLDVVDTLAQELLDSAVWPATSQYAVSIAASDDDVSLPCTP
jgi:hypothetical protein